MPPKGLLARISDSPLRVSWTSTMSESYQQPKLRGDFDSTFAKDLLSTFKISEIWHRKNMKKYSFTKYLIREVLCNRMIKPQVIALSHLTDKKQQQKHKV